MTLTKEEQRILDRLAKKADEPDAPPVNKSISASIDLSDPKSIAAAIKHGFLTADEAEDLKDDDDNGKKDGKGDTTPKRRGYFKDKDDEE